MWRNFNDMKPVCYNARMPEVQAERMSVTTRVRQRYGQTHSGLSIIAASAARQNVEQRTRVESIYM